MDRYNATHRANVVALVQVSRCVEIVKILGTMMSS
jgi:hypothetical protein